jgi:hypothetical protein
MQGLLDIKTYLTGSTKKHSLLGGSLLSFLLVCSLVFAQAVSLNHSHGSDLRDQVDCEICLKLGSSDDSLVSNSDLTFGKSATSSFDILLPAAVHTVARTPSARGPPQA